MSNNLLENTYKLIGESGLTQKEIAEGAGVNYWWFIKFAQKNLENPTIKPVQKVHDFLLVRSTQGVDPAA